jgi:hypothetical protein
MGKKYKNSKRISNAVHDKTQFIGKIKDILNLSYTVDEFLLLCQDLQLTIRNV